MSKEPWRSDKWFVSPYNFLDEVRENLKLPSRVNILDTTLRDGEQQSNIVLRRDEKIRVAQALDEAGVNMIEAGMPAVADFEAATIRDIAKLGLQADVYAFSRCMKADVELARKCDVEGIVMEIPSSHHLIEYAYGWPVEKAIELSVEATLYAAAHGLKVTFFTIDSTRAPESYWKIIDAVYSDGHMDELAVVDTFGVCHPHAVKYFVDKVREKVRKPLHFHGHNDFGLGVANAMAAVEAGVQTIHTTVNGIGERVGNTSLEEAVMAMKLLYGVDSDVKPEKLYALSNLVQDLTGVKMPPNKPVVGSNVFTTESGIVGGWWSRLEPLNMPTEMFPFTPEAVGHGKVNVVIGKKSGRDTILYKAKKLGLDIPLEKVDEVLYKVKLFAVEKKRILTDEEFAEIVEKLGKS
ncbi:MAG: pyruvate carboxyltransferase [Thaumarchaeota archaeon]|nr:pyruvate carboxyltransferase [Nitrososphaerota archaeon]